MATQRLRFPPSSAPRWLNCLASVREEQKYKKEQSDYASEGIDAHKVAELCMLDGVEPLVVDGVDQETAEAIQEYIDYIEMIKSKYPNDSVITEYTELELDLSPWIIKGQTGKADNVILCEKSNGETHLDVIDLKFGRGVQVEAYENEVMLIYAGAIIYEMSLYYDITTITIHIAQPRRNHYDSWKVTPTMVDKFMNERVKPTVKRIIASDQSDLPYVPTDKGCEFCRARVDCRALADRSLATVAEGFDNLIEPLDAFEVEPLGVREIPPLTADEVFRCMENLDLIDIWQKAIKERVKQLLENGEAPDNCNYKRVLSTKHRQWHDEEKADKAIGRQGIKAKDRRTEPKLRSPKQIEGLLGKNHKVIKEHAYTPQGVPIVVKKTDKRPAIDEQATEGFDNLEAGDLDHDELFDF